MRYYKTFAHRAARAGITLVPLEETAANYALLSLHDDLLNALDKARRYDWLMDRDGTINALQEELRRKQKLNERKDAVAIKNALLEELKRARENYGDFATELHKTLTVMRSKTMLEEMRAQGLRLAVIGNYHATQLETLGLANAQLVNVNSQRINTGKEQLEAYERNKQLAHRLEKVAREPPPSQEQV